MKTKISIKKNGITLDRLSKDLSIKHYLTPEQYKKGVRVYEGYSSKKRTGFQVVRYPSGKTRLMGHQTG